VSEQYIDSIMHGTTIKVNNTHPHLYTTVLNYRYLFQGQNTLN